MSAGQWRTLAAICLLIAGSLNALASLGYLAGGLAAKWLVAWNVDFWLELWGQDSDPGADYRHQAQTLSAYVGQLLLYWSLLLAASAPLLIAGGIQALRGATPWLIATAGYVGFVLELLGVVISGIGLLHLPGLAAGPVVFIALRRMREEQRKTPAAAGVGERSEHRDPSR